jgi:hypothetical protein
MSPKETLHICLEDQERFVKQSNRESTPSLFERRLQPMILSSPASLLNSAGEAMGDGDPLKTNFLRCRISDGL